MTTAFEKRSAKLHQTLAHLQLIGYRLESDWFIYWWYLTQNRSTVPFRTFSVILATQRTFSTDRLKLSLWQLLS